MLWIGIWLGILRFSLRTMPLLCRYYAVRLSILFEPSFSNFFRCAEDGLVRPKNFHTTYCRVKSFINTEMDFYTLFSSLHTVRYFQYLFPELCQREVRQEYERRKTLNIDLLNSGTTRNASLTYYRFHVEFSLLYLVFLLWIWTVFSTLDGLFRPIDRRARICTGRYVPFYFIITGWRYVELHEELPLRQAFLLDILRFS